MLPCTRGLESVETRLNIVNRNSVYVAVGVEMNFIPWACAQSASR